MELLEEFSDERLRQHCIHCGVYLAAGAVNSDHVPSKCLLNRPLPPDPPKVTVCAKCNSNFALDEEYLGVLLAAVLSGDTMPDAGRFPKPAAAMKRNPRLHARIAWARQEQLTLFGEHDVLWAPQAERVKRVVVKNARGHLFHELGAASPEDPISVWFLPVARLSPDRRATFERVDRGLLPEFDSRMLHRVLGIEPPLAGWVDVQCDVYRYAVMQNGDALTVRTLIRNYLATEVTWALD